MTKPTNLFGIDNLTGIITELVQALNTTQCNDAPSVVFESPCGTQRCSIVGINYEDGHVTIEIEQD